MHLKLLQKKPFKKLQNQLVISWEIKLLTKSQKLKDQKINKITKARTIKD